MQTKTKIYDVLIIGAGPSGMSAAIYAARKNLNTLLVSKDVGGQTALSADIENYLGFTLVSGPELTAKFKSHVENLQQNLTFLENKEVESLEKHNSGFMVRCAPHQTSPTQGGGNFSDRTGSSFPPLDGEGQGGVESFAAKSVIIASGRSPRWLGVPGEKDFIGKGVANCATCDAPLFKNKDVAVVGGGNSAMDAILSLAPIAKTVYSINIGPELAGDEVMKAKIKAAKNVKVLPYAKTTKIMGDKFVSGLAYQNTKDKSKHTLSVDGVFVEIGWVPNIGFDKLTQKDEQNQIVVDNDLMTSVPGVFAAGDVNNAWGEQIVIAAGEGAKAAMAVTRYLISKK